MFKCILKIGIVMSSLLIVTTTINAQNKKSKTKSSNNKASSKNPYLDVTPSGNNKKSTTEDKNPYTDNSVSSTTNKKDTIPKGGRELPMCPVDSNAIKTSSTEIKRSLVTDGAVDMQLVRDKKPLAYDYIREDDAFFKERLWREIDTREKQNQVFRYAANEDNGNQLFISILLNAVKMGEIKAYDDERFTTELSKDKALSILGGTADTVIQRDIDGNAICRKATYKPFELDSIVKYRIKEDIIFDKEASRLVTRIIGIAPMTVYRNSVGEASGDPYPAFWIYYPDARPVLAKYQVYNPRNMGARMSWEDLFEMHMFSSYIVKTTLNNFRDQKLKEYIKDPLFQLLEGEKIKEKIFNFEQNLWQY
ncbi:MAG: gliding motility protein GldN [Bacteroidetes bacterium]|nr:gliding motility protein GldN [Bacteroidota bacterium]MBS1649328.1 gliding motility protein GldN [Bacteroidota bacterium]